MQPGMYIFVRWGDKQPLHKWMAQHRMANSWTCWQQCKHHGQRWPDRWFEREVKESIYVRLEWPSLNRGDSLRHYLSPTYSAVLSCLPRQLREHSHLGSARPRNPHESLSNDPQVALSILKLRVHTCPCVLCKDTPTQSLKACNSPPVS